MQANTVLSNSSFQTGMPHRLDQRFRRVGRINEDIVDRRFPDGGRHLVGRAGDRCGIVGLDGYDVDAGCGESLLE